MSHDSVEAEIIEFPPPKKQKQTRKQRLLKIAALTAFVAIVLPLVFVGQLLFPVPEDTDED